MKLHEYQSKRLLSEFGIPIPRGRVTINSTDAKSIAEEIGGMVVVKSQVLVGGRGKAGGIRLVKDISQVEETAAKIMSMEIKGLPVRKVLIEEAVNIDQEIYLGIVNDRTSRKPVLMASSEGGVDIEEVAINSPEKINTLHINPLVGLQDFQARDIASSIQIPKQMWREFIKIVHGLWNVYRNTDATLAEINPLVITEDQRLLALDGKITIDDNALFRHPEMADKQDQGIENSVELEAKKYGLSYIKLDGEIGCLVNGAGLAMATMDMIKHFGGNPANFLDIGGGASAEKVAVAFKTILSDPNVKIILVNIFGGITRCDEVAKGIISAIQTHHMDVPLIVRLVGTNADIGMQLLHDAEMMTTQTLVEAAQKAVEISRKVIA